MADPRRAPNEAEILVFAGPCLTPPADAARPDSAWESMLRGVRVEPPAARGDVLRALARKARVLVVLDGFYYTRPAVTHQELLYALDAGIEVIGAASMGALRAAELDGEGMRGVGTVYEWLRDGLIDGDDEVAIQHLPAEYGYQGVTIALVELRHALARMREVDPAGISARQSSDLIDAMREMGFVRRTREILESLAVEHLGPAAGTDLMRRLRRESLKHEDARRALELAHELVSGPATRRPARPVSNLYLSYSFERSLCAPSSAGETRPAPTLFAIWNLFQILHPCSPEWVARRRRGFLLLSAAREAGLEPPQERVEARFESLLDFLQSASLDSALPFAEIRAEAEDLTLAEIAAERLGGVDQALSRLASSFALHPDRGPQQLLDLLSRQFDLLPAWSPARSFLFSAAFPAARDAALEADEVRRCFDEWSQGARIRRADLWRCAAELWQCEIDEVAEQAGLRGLLESDGFSPGLREALQALAPAERLRAPINAYPAARERLLASAWESPPCASWEAAGSGAEDADGRWPSRSYEVA